MRSPIVAPKKDAQWYRQLQVTAVNQRQTPSVLQHRTWFINCGNKSKQQRDNWWRCGDRRQRVIHTIQQEEKKDERHPVTAKQISLQLHTSLKKRRESEEEERMFIDWAVIGAEKDLSYFLDIISKIDATSVVPAWFSLAWLWAMQSTHPSLLVDPAKLRKAD